MNEWWRRAAFMTEKSQITASSVCLEASALQFTNFSSGCPCSDNIFRDWQSWVTWLSISTTWRSESIKPKSLWQMMKLQRRMLLKSSCETWNLDSSHTHAQTLHWKLSKATTGKSKITCSDGADREGNRAVHSKTVQVFRKIALMPDQILKQLVIQYFSSSMPCDQA